MGLLVLYVITTHISLTLGDNAKRFVGDYSKQVVTENVVVSPAIKQLSEDIENLKHIYSFSDIDKIDWKNDIKEDFNVLSQNKNLKDIDADNQPRPLSAESKRDMEEALKMADNLMIFQIFNAIFSWGNKQLENFGKKIKTRLEKDGNDTGMFNNLYDDYFYFMNENFSSLNKKIVKEKNKLNEELYLIDLVHSSSNILEYQLHVLIIEMKSVANNRNVNITEDNWKKLESGIKKVVSNEKKRGFAILCKKTEICKRYPAFLDHINEILVKILKLPDNKFNTIAKIFKDKLNNLCSFGVLKLVMSNDVANYLNSKLRLLDADISQLRDVLEILRITLTHRHQAYGINEKNITMSWKAFRILTDLFDKPFASISEDTIKLEVKEVTDGLDSWKANDNFDIEKVMIEFINEFEVVITPFLQLLDVRAEVKTLLDLIVKGSSKNILTVDKNLLSEGSRHVNVEFFQ